MLSTLRKSSAWRWVAVAALLAALLLPLMPTAAYAATQKDVNWNGACREFYHVRQGDQLLQIARWFGVSLHDIAMANDITNPSLIFPGQRLCIPARGSGHPDGGPGGHPGGGHPGGGWDGGCWYTVRSGDNLSRIGAWFGVPWPHLARVNNLDNARVIVPGQRLWVCW